ncbi:uncharacterized protein BBA_10189 [Beauveria bassiana ARSEF 2860]|uniref:Uncharacterized protein n=1 Tax=Beauveria bassiana (strain ARSEF 2860) TaxID=655819 RepID=J5J1W3_BEAB2|nr:uncharacterized protein BBA_10189 [Beauveria bassiana ARSEF 2860]EJP60868.1 hypothetical protein BBA_10189 [Beauveria bassiana ARSEF 2860]
MALQLHEHPIQSPQLFIDIEAYWPRLTEDAKAKLFRQLHGLEPQLFESIALEAPAETPCQQPITNGSLATTSHSSTRQSESRRARVALPAERRPNRTTAPHRAGYPRDAGLRASSAAQPISERTSTAPPTGQRTSPAPINPSYGTPRCFEGIPEDVLAELGASSPEEYLMKDENVFLLDVFEAVQKNAGDTWKVAIRRRFQSMAIHNLHCGERYLLLSQELSLGQMLLLSPTQASFYERRLPLRKANRNLHIEKLRVQAANINPNVLAKAEQIAWHLCMWANAAWSQRMTNWPPQISNKRRRGDHGYGYQLSQPICTPLPGQQISAAYYMPSADQLSSRLGEQPRQLIHPDEVYVVAADQLSARLGEQPRQLIHPDEGYVAAADQLSARLGEQPRQTIIPEGFPMASMGINSSLIREQNSQSMNLEDYSISSGVDNNTLLISQTVPSHTAMAQLGSTPAPSNWED